MARKWYPVKEASMLLGVSDRTVRRWVTEKKYKAREINKITHVLLDDFETPKTEPETSREDIDTRQAKEGKEEGSVKDTSVLFTELVKQLEVKDQQIKDLNERLRETGLLLNNAQLRLAPPSTGIDNGDAISFDTKSPSEGVVGPKKGKFLDVLVKVLGVFVMLGILLVIGLFITGRL
jgi:phage antirepressor YoqD-like protein